MLEKMIDNYADNSKEVLELLEITDQGQVVSSIKNCLLIFQNDNYFSNVKMDTMRYQPCRVVEDGKREYWKDTDDAKTLEYFEEHYKIRNKQNINVAFTIFLDERKFNPLQELIQNYVWDGKPHCESFYVQWMGAENTPYTREVSRIDFLQRIMRAFEPGCKADQVLVLIGPQGCGKSTITRWSALEDSFYASVTTIKGQKGYEAIQGKFICELEELAATTGGGTKIENKVKAFISSQCDHYRLPYGKRSSDNPRS